MNFKSKASIIKQKIMKELIKITDINGRKVVSARELHTFLEVETPPRLWFPRMLEYGFESGIDFEEVQISTPSGQTANDLALTLDTAKEIAMIQSIDKGKEAKVCNLGIGRNRLFQFLRDEKILQQNNSPYQSEIDSGHMRMVESKYTKPDGSVCINLKTVVMQKGVDFIIKRWNKRQTQ